MSVGMKDQKLSKRAQRKAENAAANNVGSLTNGNLFYAAGGIGALIGVGAIASFASILSESWGGGTSIPFIDMYDPKVVQSTFLSGEPNIVYCVSDKTEGGALPDLIGKIKAEVMKSKHGEGATFVAANCFRKSEVLENKTVAEKYGFGKNEGFLAVFVNRETPLQLNYLADAQQVSKQIVPLLKIEIKKAVYLKDFEVCQTGKSCIVLGGRTKMAAKASGEHFKEYMRSYRGLKMVAVDTGFYDLKLGSAFVEAQPRGDAMSSPADIDKDLLETDVVCIANVLQPKKSKTGRGEDEYKHFGKWLGSWEGDGVDGLMKDCQALGNTLNSTPDKAAEAEKEILELGFTELSEKPAIKAKGSDAKPKVINAEANPMFKGKKGKGKKRGDVGLAKGGKESVGRRPDEKAEDDDDAIFPDEEGSEGEEGEEENMFGDEAGEAVEEEA